MANDFILFQKFTDIETAEEFTTELQENGIAYKIVDQRDNTNVKVVGYNPIEVAIAVNIRQEDFPKADQILEEYYNGQLKHIDRSYYLFESTDEELKEIIANPFDWGRLDYQLAKSILKERGTDVSEAEIQTIKDNKLTELSQKKKAGNFKIAIGYILAFILPLIGILIGITIKYNRKVLPTGERFYIHSDNERKHGHRIIVIGLIMTILFVLRVLLHPND
jgi:hypothetical protein